MIAKTLRVMLTMDCERVRDSEFYPAGPATWQESARNISAFADVAEEYGFRVTFFSVPEAVEAHGDLFKKLLALGHEVALHLHPHTFRYGVNEYLGNLPYDRQVEILTEAVEAFTAVMGFTPTSFRPGHFSANADTFRALALLGFLRGSSAIPGRYMPGTGSDWRDWPRRCHYVGSVFEAPVTVHYLKPVGSLVHAARHMFRLGSRGFLLDALRNAAMMVRRGKGDATMRGTMLADLRIESGSYSLTNEIIEAELARMQSEGQLGVLTSVTHSYINYSERDYGSREHAMSRRSHLTKMLGSLRRLRDLEVESCTLIQAHRDFEAGALSG